MTTAASTAPNTSRFQPLIDRLRQWFNRVRAEAPVIGRQFWQEERHWLWIITPLLVLTWIAIKWCKNSWTTLDNSLIFQPFMPLAALTLAWVRRIEVGELQKEMSYLFPTSSPKRRGNLWLVLVGALLMLIAAVTTASTFRLLGLVMIVAGGFYYLYGPFLTRLLWLPFAMLFLTVPLPIAIVEQMQRPLKIGGTVLGAQLLHLFVPATFLRFDAIELPHYELVVDSSLSGLNVLLASLALTLSFCLIKYVRAGYTLILMTASAVIAVFLNFIRIVLTGVIGNLAGLQSSDPNNTIFPNICSVLLVIATAFLTLYVVRLLDSNKFQRVSQFEADLREAAMSNTIGPTVAEAAAAVLAAKPVAAPHAVPDAAVASPGADSPDQSALQLSQTETADTPETPEREA